MCIPLLSAGMWTNWLWCFWPVWFSQSWPLMQEPSSRSSNHQSLSEFLIYSSFGCSCDCGCSHGSALVVMFMAVAYWFIMGVRLTTCRGCVCAVNSDGCAGCIEAAVFLWYIGTVTHLSYLIKALQVQGFRSLGLGSFINCRKTHLFQKMSHWTDSPLVPYAKNKQPLLQRPSAPSYNLNK